MKNAPIATSKDDILRAPDEGFFHGGAARCTFASAWKPPGSVDTLLTIKTPPPYSRRAS